MKQTSLFSKIRRLALCLILGGLLLLTFVGCQGEISLSALYDPDDVAKLEFYDIDFSQTHLFTEDRADIDQLGKVLDRIKGTPAEPIELLAQGISLVFHLKNGETFQMTFNNTDRRVYCVSHTADGKFIDSQWYVVSDDDRSLVESCVSSLREKHLPLMEVPDPEEYLNETFSRVSRMQWENEDVLQKADVPIKQIDSLTAFLREALTDLPHYGQKPTYDARRYTFLFKTSANSYELEITLYPDSKLIEIRSEKAKNAYYFQLTDQQIETILTLSDTAE